MTGSTHTFDGRLARNVGRLQFDSSKIGSSVTERIRKLEKAKDAAEASSRAKTRFLAELSHDLTSYLNAIVMVSDDLRDPAFQEGSDVLLTITQGAERLLRLLDDVRQAEDIESGRKSLNMEPCSLGSIVRNVEYMTRLHARPKGLDFAVFKSDAFPEDAVTDANRLQRILINLLDNAVYYTETGWVNLKLHAERQGNLADRSGAQEIRLIIQVEDTGIGIAPDEQMYIFEPFVRGVDSRTRKGVGLGLAIVRESVDALGGTIRIESEKNKGSRFRVELPVQEAPESFVRSMTPDAEAIGELRGLGLKALPARLQSDLRQALMSLRVERIDTALRRITSYDSALGEALKRWAAQHEHALILAALEEKAATNQSK